MRRQLLFVLVLLITIAPSDARGAVVITEIMFDLPGTDSGREWVEIQNVDTASVDTALWRLSEGGVNHKLIANGTSVLAQGSFAVIARNADAFRKDWPQFAGVLLTSSFSLHNSGETVSLKNETLETVSTITYDARYAKGDGNSLNFVVGEPVSRRPTPGSSVASDVLVSPVEEAPEATKKAITIGTIVQRNLSETVEVSEVDAIDGGGMDGGVYAASFIDGGGAPGMSLMSLMPWFVSLLAVMGVGISAILFRKKKSKSGYTIIEEKS